MADVGPDDPDAPPRLWIAQAEEELGTAELLSWCAELLAGADPAVSRHPLTWIGGRHAAQILAQGLLEGSRARHHRYWPRVWAARCMRYAWLEDAPVGDVARAALVGALGDEQWRVREKAAEIIGLREVAAGADRLAGLLSHDGTPRVRAAAARALAAVAEHEHLGALAACAEQDAERAVRGRARLAYRAVVERLDLPAGT